jgi:hypothetical protein
VELTAAAKAALPSKAPLSDVFKHDFSSH